MHLTRVAGSDDRVEEPDILQQRGVVQDGQDGRPADDGNGVGAEAPSAAAQPCAARRQPRSRC